jgi:hypothetical protein
MLARRLEMRQGHWPFALVARSPIADASSDLKIWTVAETFPNYALLYTNTNEMGKHYAASGRGTQRGCWHWWTYGGDQLRGRDTTDALLSPPPRALISTWSVLPAEKQLHNR